MSDRRRHLLRLAVNGRRGERRRKGDLTYPPSFPSLFFCERLRRRRRRFLLEAVPNLESPDWPTASCALFSSPPPLFSLDGYFFSAFPAAVFFSTVFRRQRTYVIIRPSLVPPLPFFLR